MEHTKKILASTENYKITLYTANKSGKCIITFGEVDSKLEETGFASKLILEEGYDHIYVAQKLKTQYQFLDAEKFKEIVENEIRNKEVYTYGSSLGAYCAIYYGGMIHANILALSPRIPAHPVISELMGDVGGVFVNRGFFHKDLTELPASREKVHIFYDDHSYIDNYYVNIFIKPAYPRADYHIIKHAGHYTARALLLSGELKNVAKSFFENKELTYTLNEDEIIQWHMKRTKVRLNQNKLFHARENIDVLLRAGNAYQEDTDKLIHAYREKLLSAKMNKKKEIHMMEKNPNLTKEEQELFNRINIETNKKAFRRFHKAGLLHDVDESYLTEVNDYWKKHYGYGKEIDPVLNAAFTNLTKKDGRRVIPSRVMWYEIIPYFNDMNIRIGYSDKNIYDIMFAAANAPKTVLKRVRGHYFDTDNQLLTAQEAHEAMVNYGNDMIIKPSDTDNGKGINKIKYENGSIYLDGEPVEMDKLAEVYGYNFTVQEVIRQHEVMAKPHPASVNTLRMVTLRWKNEVKYLMTFARFGADHSVRDNAGMGGLCVGITDDGEFLDFAIDEHAKVYTHHPTTNYEFAQHAKIPNFDKFKDFVIQLHKNILHHDFVSWDIAVGEDGEPVFIEANYRGATWLYQLAAQRPLFGDLTEEILEHISSELKQKTDRDVQSNLTKTNRKLKQDVSSLKKENNLLKSQLNKQKDVSVQLRKANEQSKKLKAEISAIKNSKSWKSTAILRKFAKKVK